MIILGIETSCDETAASVISSLNGEIKVLSNIVSSQIALHKEWGGVVPNLAARVHLQNILPVIGRALQKARVQFKDIDLIAVTKGPGLIPALLVGVNTAKTLSYTWQKPLLGIHHIEGHIYANFVDNRQTEEIEFPILCLVVSGGHTQLVLMKKHLDYKIIGQTQDDAAGEAFDKVARILGLDYPGGPEIAKRAAQNLKQQTKDKRYVLSDLRLPRPMINTKDFNFSFSGLKTAVLYLVKKNEQMLESQQFINKVAHEFQQAAVDVLIAKTLAAAKKYKPKTILLAGGVSANAELRKQLGKAIQSQCPDIKYRIPSTEYSLDNAAMIATAAYYRWKREKNKSNLHKNWKCLAADANLSLK